jgi:hypothetical protein
LPEIAIGKNGTGKNGTGKNGTMKLTSTEKMAPDNSRNFIESLLNSRVELLLLFTII